MRFFIISILLNISICIGYSQTITVTSFKLLESDLTANTAGTIEQDQNGETAALIKVVTTQTGFTFDGGALGVVKTKQTPGEIWVYIPKGAKKITIKHPQLGVLRDYFFPTSIEAAKTYEMVLASGTVQTIVQQARTSQYVVFQLTPPNAIVELEGSLLQTVDGTASKMMKFGSYDYRVQAPNYIPEAGKVTVNDPENKHLVNVSLKPNFSRVTVKVDNNAEIWVNGEKKGNGTWTGDLGEGTYEFEAKKQGHRSTLTTQDIVATDKPLTFNLQAPMPIYGEADVNSSPAMADLFIDGEKKGQTPQLISKLLIGSHQVRISRDGYNDYSTSITIKEGERTSIVAQLGKKGNNSLSSQKDIASNQFDNQDLSGLKKIYKKEPIELVKIGKRLLEQKKLKEAQEFAELAITSSRSKNPFAFILYGDIEAISGNPGSAATYYEKAIKLDPKSPEPYYKYALVYREIDPQGAARKLDELKANRPDISIETIKGHIFMLANNYKSAYNEFKKVPVNQIDPDYLNEFARASYFGGHFEDALAACEEGLKHKPGNPAFTRLAMFSNYELKNYDAAKAYLQKYFHELDSVKFSEYDYYYAALIYDALNDIDNAVESYQKALGLIEEMSLIKRWTILKNLALLHQKKNDINKAINYYQEYLTCKPDINIADYETLADIYIKTAKTSTGPSQISLYNKAADIYSNIIQKFPSQKAYAVYKRAELINKTDKNMEKRLAKADYQQVINILGNKTNRTKSEDTMLKYSLHYLMFSSYLDSYVSIAKGYAKKILTIDPTYNPALEILNLK